MNRRLKPGSIASMSRYRHELVFTVLFVFLFVANVLTGVTAFDLPCSICYHDLRARQ